MNSQADQKEIYIHIGLMKTGSTSIQNQLNEERQNLASNYDLWIPSFDRNHGRKINAIFRGDDQHLRNVLGVTDFDDGEEIRAATLEELATNIRETPCSKILISGEDLSSFRPQEAAAFLNWIAEEITPRYTVLCFVRCSASWFHSWLQERVKHRFGMSESVDYFCETNIFQESIQPWLDLAPQSSFIPLKFEEARERGLLESLLEKLGIADFQFSGPKTGLIFSNTSLCSEAVQLVEQLNQRTETPVEVRSQFLEFAGRLRGRKFRFDATASPRIQTALERNDRWIDETFSLVSTPDSGNAAYQETLGSEDAFRQSITQELCDLISRNQTLELECLKVSKLEARIAKREKKIAELKDSQSEFRELKRFKKAALVQWRIEETSSAILKTCLKLARLLRKVAKIFNRGSPLCSTLLC